MLKEHKLFRAFSTPLVLAFSVMLVACGHVKRDEFSAEMAAIRGEIAEGDEGVERRLGTRVDALENELTTFRAEVETALQDLEQNFDMQMERFQTALRFNAPVFFAFDESSIRAEDEGSLNQFAGVVSEFFPTALVTVEGFTDQIGSRDYNLKLGQERADAVKAYLVDAGLAPERLRSVSYGEDTRRLIVHGAVDRESALDNRRVVLVIDHTDATAGAQQVISGRSNEIGNN